MFIYQRTDKKFGWVYRAKKKDKDRWTREVEDKKQKKKKDRKKKYYLNKQLI